MGWFLSSDDSILHRIESKLHNLVLGFNQIENKINRLDRKMSEAQDKLDTMVANVTEAVGNVETEMAALKQAVIDAGVTVDFTAADAAVQRLNATTAAIESDETPPV